MPWIKIAAIAGVLAVAFGAFGAHALRNRVDANLFAAYQTGVLYHLVHAAALLSLALYARATAARIVWPATLWALGILLFSGSLYALALTGVSKLGIITPVGGLCMLGGWLALLVAR